MKTNMRNGGVERASIRIDAPIEAVWMLIHQFGSREGLVTAVVEAVERDQNGGSAHVLGGIGSVIDKVLPDPLSTWLEGAGLSVGMLCLLCALSSRLVERTGGTVAADGAMQPGRS
jgi:hypothetical protein